jgi:hypothetical protein
MRTSNKLFVLQANHAQFEFFLTVRTKGVKIKHGFPFL